jgi:hypothetical protein
MKVEAKGLQNAFKKLPRKQRKYIGDAIRKSVNEGVRLARVMAPVDTGELKRGIHAKFDIEENAFVGSVEAAPARREPQVKATRAAKSDSNRRMYSNKPGRQMKSHLCAERKRSWARNTGLALSAQ